MRKRLNLRRREHARNVAEHQQVLTDLEDKDKIIDDLLRVADGLVDDLRVSLERASASLRESAGEAEDGGEPRKAAGSG